MDIELRLRVQTLMEILRRGMQMLCVASRPNTPTAREDAPVIPVGVLPRREREQEGIPFVFGDRGAMNRPIVLRKDVVDVEVRDAPVQPLGRGIAVPTLHWRHLLSSEVGVSMDYRPVLVLITLRFLVARRGQPYDPRTGYPVNTAPIYLRLHFAIDFPNSLRAEDLLLVPPLSLLAVDQAGVRRGAPLVEFRFELDDGSLSAEWIPLPDQNADEWLSLVMPPRQFYPIPGIGTSLGAFVEEGTVLSTAGWRFVATLSHFDSRSSPSRPTMVRWTLPRERPGGTRPGGSGGISTRSSRVYPRIWATTDIVSCSQGKRRVVC